MADYRRMIEDLFFAPARAFMAQPPKKGPPGLLGDIHRAIDPVRVFGGYGGLLAMALPPGAPQFKSRLSSPGFKQGAFQRNAPESMLPESEQIARAKSMGAAAPDEVWYHGTPVDLTKTPERGFRPLAGETGTEATWASNNPFVAEEYARGEISLTADSIGRYPITKSWFKESPNEGGGVYSLRSLAKNPKIVDAGGKNWTDVNRKAVLDDAKAAGHDAVIFRNMKDNMFSDFSASDIIAWLDPTKIRALGARFKKPGTDILASGAGAVSLGGILAKALNEKGGS